VTTIDESFANPPGLLHPRVRNWKARLGEPRTSATLEVFRPETDLGQSQPEMNVQFTQNDHPLSLETVPWDDDLNSGLIGLGVKEG